MPFVTFEEVRGALDRSIDWRIFGKAAPVILRESVNAFDAKKTYDIFLSHCFSRRRDRCGSQSVVGGARADCVRRLD